MKNRNKKNRNYDKNRHNKMTAREVYFELQNSFDMVNKYGTYEVQSTSDTENDFPQIAQGLSKKEREEYEKNN